MKIIKNIRKREAVGVATLASPTTIGWIDITFPLSSKDKKNNTKIKI